MGSSNYEAPYNVIFPSAVIILVLDADAILCTLLANTCAFL
jgi:hypothetical protein